jgi:hypothetical protein
LNVLKPIVRVSCREKMLSFAIRNAKARDIFLKFCVKELSVGTRVAYTSSAPVKEVR